jgi:hypothetical protein
VKLRTGSIAQGRALAQCTQGPVYTKLQSTTLQKKRRKRNAPFSKDFQSIVFFLAFDLRIR